MLPVIRVGPATIQSSLLAFVAALWLGGMAAESGLKRRGLPGDAAWNVIAIGTATTIVAARLTYVAQNWTAYGTDWPSIFALTPGTLAMEYGAVLGLVAAYATLQRRKIPVARFADAVAPGALVAIAVVAFGQFLSGDAYGDTSNVPWAISIYGELRHPVQLYDAFAALVGAIFVWRIARRPTPEGSIARLALIWYSAARVFVDAFRGDAVLLFDEYRETQIVALVLLLAALWGISRLEPRKIG